MDIRAPETSLRRLEVRLGLEPYVTRARRPFPTQGAGGDTAGPGGLSRVAYLPLTAADDEKGAAERGSVSGEGTDSLPPHIPSRHVGSPSPSTETNVPAEKLSRPPKSRKEMINNAAPLLSIVLESGKSGHIAARRGGRCRHEGQYPLGAGDK